MTNTNFKFQVLQVASAHNPEEGPELVIARAKMYMEHLVGVVEEGHEVLPPVGTEVSEPGFRRKRRTKAEIEADAKIDSLPVNIVPEVNEESEDETRPVPPPAMNAGAYGIPYKTVQDAVLTAVDKGYHARVKLALLQFTAKTALDLKPEQYQEFMDVLEAKLSEPTLA